MTATRRQKIACLSVDVEPDLWCPQRRIRLFENDAHLDALCALLRRRGVPLTSFVVMKDAARYAAAFAELEKAIEVEFAVHSFNHDQRLPVTADEVKRAWDAYGDLWNWQPRGYRSPNCLIDTRGLHNLAEQGFVYDSSVTPSVRFDRYGYNNLHLPTTPFRVQPAERQILEFPIACLGGIRMPFILSYMKLFGPRAVSAAGKLLPLPDVAVVYFHPYDLYVAEMAAHGRGWKKYAHLRNAQNGVAILDGMIEMLTRQGYKFMLMEDVASELARADLPLLASLSA